MAEQTKIEWTDHTFNPWIGCQKVSVGCDHCYAEQLADRRYGWVQWGPHGTRKVTSVANWRKPLTWNRAAEREGARRRVFCASLADVMDNRAPEGARDRLYALILETPFLDWQLLTKRPENLERYRPAGGWPPNVWLGTTCEDQGAYNRRWPKLAREAAAVRFISYEPAIGPLSIARFDTVPDWLIWGGESGPGARPMDPEWARAITQECEAAGVAVFGKQWGTWPNNPLYQLGVPIFECRRRDPHGKGGALLDGRLWRQFPEPAHIVMAGPGMIQGRLI